MSVRELRHDRPSGRFSKPRGLSASVSFLSSPPPPRSFTYAIFRAVFDSRSSFFVACTARKRLLRRLQRTRNESQKFKLCTGQSGAVYQKIPKYSESALTFVSNFFQCGIKLAIIIIIII